MPTPARILRAEAENLDRTGPQRTSRQIQRHERIVSAARTLMANHGSHNITFTNLAIALSVGNPTLRSHFPDLDSLLGEILRRHLLALSAALGEIPPGSPNRTARLREAYLAFTRTPLGGLTEAHLLLTRDIHLLPGDIRDPLEQTRDGLGDLVGGPFARETLLLLDTPYITLGRIEAMLASLHQPEPAAAAKPAAPPPRPAPPRPVRPLPPELTHPAEKPGAWIYDLIPATARAPPA